MKKRVAFILVLFFFKSSVAQQSYKMTLLSHWNDTSLTHVDGDQIWSDLTGWYDSIKKREYIIAGGVDSIYFFDITNPNTIKLVAVEDGKSKFAVNRDFETYLHYVYCVSQKGTPGALQIFDLQYLPDSVHKVYQAQDVTANAHTIFIEAKSKRMYACENMSTTTGLSAMDIISIASPENPVLLAKLQVPSNTSGQKLFDKVHEMYSRNDTAYLSAYVGLFIFDLTNLINQKFISSIVNYPFAGTNHSSWLNDDGKKILFTDENQGLPAKIFDISDIKNPRSESTFNSNANALPHNAYWKKNKAIVSCYEDGVYVYDISNTKKPIAIAWYDTYPKNLSGEYHGFHGCWGVWPFLPSGNIIASDISEGIFVLKVDSSASIDVVSENDFISKIYPNPFADKLHIQINKNLGTELEIEIFDIQGKVIYSKNNVGNSSELFLQIDEAANWQSGFYTLKIFNSQQQKVFKLVKI